MDSLAVAFGRARISIRTLKNFSGSVIHKQQEKGDQFLNATELDVDRLSHPDNE